MKNFFSAVGLAKIAGVHRSTVTRLQAERQIEAVAILADGVGRNRPLFDGVAADVVRASVKRSAAPTPGASIR